MAICAMNLPPSGARFPFDLFELHEAGGLPDHGDGRHQRTAVMTSTNTPRRCAASAEGDYMQRVIALADAAEVELQRERQRTTFALDAAGVGVWEVAIGDRDGDGEDFWSEHMYRLRGLDPEDPRPIGELAALVTDPADLETALRLQRRHIELGEPYAHEFRVRWPDGTERWLASRAQLVRDGDGHPTALSGVNFDVTEQRRAEAARLRMARAERENRAKSVFVTGLSHELRTPLNAVLVFGQLLLEDKRDPPTARQRARLEHIHRAASHMLALANQTLDLASIEAGQQALATEPVALADCAREAMGWLEPVARARGVTVRLDGLEGCVVADARSLRQVAANLVSNAVKYNRPGGWVVVQGRRRNHHGTEQCALIVRDSGRGLTDDQMQHLFEPFNRLGAEREGIEGTGMGLAIARELVQRMGGEVEVESEAGGGSEFRVWLPASRD
jgi:PAS domain S-box-containing protein